MQNNPYIAMLYGPNKDLAIQKMMSVNAEWAGLVNHHAFSDRYWGKTWGKDNYAMTDKEVITLSALISSGLANQTALHIHGFLGSGGTLKELAALMHAAWRPRGSTIDPQFIDRMAGELAAYPGVEQFISDVRSNDLPLSGLDVKSPLVGFTRLQLSELASAISAGKSEWPQLTNLMKQAQDRGATVVEIELILRHAEIYLGESAAIEGAQAWNEITTTNDGDLKRMYIDNVHAYFADKQFYEWLPAAEEDPAFKPLFDMTLALASARAEKVETNIEEYISLNRGITEKDYNKLAFVVVKATRYRPGLLVVVKEFLEKMADDKSKSAKVRTAASNVLALTETIAQDPVRLTYGHIDRFSLGEIVALATVFANGHTHQNEFQSELKRAIERGLDDATFQRLANRATRIVGYPVAMNAYIAYEQAKKIFKVDRI
ncbi:MAG: hypothetical protein KF681_10930 [Bdellovibrionaceae bacterium]|nr:hypothetical protein [Pseudobdellovibrionaceae bacterium]